MPCAFPNRLLSDQLALQEALLNLVTDPDPQVRMQLAYSLGEWRDPRAGRALADIAIGDADDALMIAAVMSSATFYLVRCWIGFWTAAVLVDPKSRWWKTSCDWSWNRRR